LRKKENNLGIPLRVGLSALTLFPKKGKGVQTIAPIPYAKARTRAASQPLQQRKTSS